MQTPPAPPPPPLPSSTSVPALGRDSRSQGGLISRDGTDKDSAMWNLKLMPFLICVSGLRLLWPPLLAPCPPASLAPCSMPEPGVPVPLPSHYQRRPAGAARAPGGEAAGAEAQCSSGLKVILGERGSSIASSSY